MRQALVAFYLISKYLGHGWAQLFTLADVKRKSLETLRVEFQRAEEADLKESSERGDNSPFAGDLGAPPPLPGLSYNHTTGSGTLRITADADKTVIVASERGPHGETPSPLWRVAIPHGFRGELTPEILNPSRIKGEVGREDQKQWDGACPAEYAWVLMAGVCRDLGVKLIRPIPRPPGLIRPVAGRTGRRRRLGSVA